MTVAIFALFAHAFAFAAMVLWLAARGFGLNPRGRALALVAGFAAALLPLGGLPVVEYVRAALGDPSITSIVLLGLFVRTQLSGRQLVPGRELRAVQFALAGVAPWFYPMALGFGGLDPYTAGFGSSLMLTLLLLVAAGALWARLHLLAVCIVSAAGAFLAGLLESNNLWDYLLDPLAALYALAALLIRGAALVSLPTKRDQQIST